MSVILCSIPIVAGLFEACLAPAPLATGYVEGEFLMMAPVSVAQVEQVLVRRGETVDAGVKLARMERRDAEIALARAEAAVARARNELADLKAPRRAEEIQVIEAELKSAQSREREADKEARRIRDLLRRGVVSQSQADDAETKLDVARALVAEMKANLAVAGLPAREQQIAAAEAAVNVARATRDEAAWQLDQRDIISPKPGMVFEIFRRQGEIAGPEAPVLSFLPDGAVLLRLYMPENQFADIGIGTELTVGCNGCPEGMQATISYISQEPEFTPPVIYSLENRQKLVYMIEARPAPEAHKLKPGQIVDVWLDPKP